MKKFKTLFKFLISVIGVIFIIIFLSIRPIISFYLSNNPSNKRLLSFILLILISTAITKLIDFKEILKKIYNELKRLQCKFVWKPSTPRQSNMEIKPIAEHPKDYQFDFENFELVLNQKIEGIDALRQHIIKFINTPKNKYKIYKGTNYGAEHLLFSTTSNEEFCRQADNLAEQIINYYGEWIEKIYCIKRTNNYLTIELKVNGKADTFSIEVPNLDYFLNKKNLKK